MRMLPTLVATSLALAVSSLSLATAVADLRADLIRDAHTFVPASANPGYRRLLDGAPLEVIAGITGAEFHIPGVPSSLGMSKTPIPVHKVENGVEYWQITGELSGYYVDEWGTYLVIGPIDRNGVNHRHDVGHPHLRSGVPGAFFSLSIPAHGLNGGIVQVQPAADAGFSWPAAPLAFNLVDPPVLLGKGYAVFTFGAGGTAPIGDDNGTPTFIDTNPNDATNIFWLFPVMQNQDDLSHLASYQRIGIFDGANELPLPSPTFISFWDPCFDNDENGNCLSGQNGFDISQPQFAYFPLQTYPEILSNTGIFARNLMRVLRGPSSARWLAWMGWSGSGHNALLIDAGTRAGAFQVPPAVGPEVGGGNYVRWNDPSSGRRYDAFLALAPALENQAFIGETGFHFIVPDPAHPINAPLAIVLGDADVTLPQAGPYAYANHVAEALALHGQGSRINDLLRIYAIPGLSHQDHSQLYAEYDRLPSDDAVWYDYADVFPNPGAFNTEGRGYRVSAAYAKIVNVDGPPDSWDDFFHGDARTPRAAPVLVGLIDSLRARTEQGRALPRSRVHPNFFRDISSIDTDTAVPPLPDVSDQCDVDFNQFYASGFACAHSLSSSAALPTVPLRDVDVAELRTFAASNPLARTIDPLVLPDVAAPLGFKLYFFDLTVEIPYSQGELRARYGSHAGYVLTFARAALRLVAEGLFDPALAARYIEVAARSDVLTRGHGWVFGVSPHRSRPAFHDGGAPPARWRHARN